MRLKSGLIFDIIILNIDSIIPGKVNSMDNQIHNAIVNFIWGIADDCLRDVYVRGKYRDVILPMTVIRRLDAMLEDSKQCLI